MMLPPVKPRSVFFCFCLPMHRYMDGMISEFDVFCGDFVVGDSW